MQEERRLISYPLIGALMCDIFKRKNRVLLSLSELSFLKTGLLVHIQGYIRIISFMSHVKSRMSCLRL